MPLKIRVQHLERDARIRILRLLLAAVERAEDEPHASLANEPFEDEALLDDETGSKTAPTLPVDVREIANAPLRDQFRSIAPRMLRKRGRLASLQRRGNIGESIARPCIRRGLQRIEQRPRMLIPQSAGSAFGAHARREVRGIRLCALHEARELRASLRKGALFRGESIQQLRDRIGHDWRGFGVLARVDDDNRDVIPGTGLERRSDEPIGTLLYVAVREQLRNAIVGQLMCEPIRAQKVTIPRTYCVATHIQQERAIPADGPCDRVIRLL